MRPTSIHYRNGSLKCTNKIPLFGFLWKIKCGGPLTWTIRGLRCPLCLALHPHTIASRNDSIFLSPDWNPSDWNPFKEGESIDRRKHPDDRKDQQ